MKDVASLPAEEQVKRGVAKLQELSPGFDDNVEHRIEAGTLTMFRC